MLTVRRLAGAFVAVTLGVLVVACSALLTASSRPAVPDRLARAAVLVQSPATRTPADPFPPTVPWSSAAADDLARRLGAVPGVSTALRDRVFYAQPLGDDRIVEGHGWSSARLSRARLVAGRAPQRAGEVVLDRALGPVTLLTASGPARYTVTGTVDAAELYLADDEAAARAPGVSTIGLALTPDANVDSVAAAARRTVGSGGQVLTGDDRGALEPRADARTRWIGMQILTGTAALAAFATVFVVASTFALAVAQRRRELALLRTIGATPRQVGRMLRREALTVGAAGSVLGTALGAALAPVLGRVLVDAGMEPSTYTVRFVTWPIAAALLLGPVVAGIGVSVAAWRAGRIRPLEALREAEVDRRPMGRSRWIAGGLVTAGGVLCGVATATAADARRAGDFALLGAIALVTGAAVLAPAVVPAVVRLLTWPAGRLPGATALLVRQGALAAPRRTAATAAPILLTVAFAVLVSGLVKTTTEAYAVGRGAALSADQVVAPDGTPGLTDAAAASVRGVAVLPTTVFAGTRPLAVLGVDPSAYVQAQRRVRVLSGSLDGLREPGTAVVTASVAALRSTAAGSPSGPPVGPDSRSPSSAADPSGSPRGSPFGAAPGLGSATPATGASTLDPAGSTPGSDSATPGLGGVVGVVFADGTRSALLVVAVVADGSIPGDLLLSREAVRRHDPSALTSAVYVNGPVTVAAGTGARLISVREYAAEADAAEDRLVWIFTLLLIGVSAGYGAIAVANTLLMASAARGPDLRVLRRTGATTGRIRRALAAEAAVVVAIGSLLGGVAAAGALVAIRAGLSEQAGAPVPLVIAWPVVAAVLGLCLLLSIAAAITPTFRGQR
ncbi:MAG TPA: FtsX-like permease family protein [Actinoplanes sp.]